MSTETTFRAQHTLVTAVLQTTVVKMGKCGIPIGVVIAAMVDTLGALLTAEPASTREELRDAVAQRLDNLIKQNAGHAEKFRAELEASIAIDSARRSSGRTL